MTGLLRALPRIQNEARGWPWDEETPTPAALTSNGRPWPTIAIVTPSYNQAQFVEESMRSVLLQNYPRLQYIVMDGGSSDDSAAIIRSYAPWLTQWTSAADRGQSDAIDRGFAQLPDADIYGWLNSDDVLLPGTLAAVGAFFAKEPDCEWLSGDGIFTYESDPQHRYDKRVAAYTTRDLLEYGRGKHLPQPSVFFSAELYRRVGGVSRDLRYAMDLDLWLRMSQEARLYHLPAFLSKLRQHAAAKTVRDNGLAIAEVEAVVRQHARGHLGRTELFGAIAALRKVRAENMCAAGLEAYFAANRPEAWRALASAAVLYPPVVCSRGAMRVALRLVLPRQIKTGIFVRP